jgi:hypothetical protein
MSASGTKLATAYATACPHADQRFQARVIAPRRKHGGSDSREKGLPSTDSDLRLSCSTCSHTFPFVHMQGPLRSSPSAMCSDLANFHHEYRRGLRPASRGTCLAASRKRTSVILNSRNSGMSHNAWNCARRFGRSPGLRRAATSSDIWSRLIPAGWLAERPIGARLHHAVRRR